MANPSSSHHDRDERHRRDSRSSHHHRTISSTTLLLVLSLILAVLAVMLSLPASNGSAPNPGSEPGGLLGYLTPKRSQTIVAREHAVAVREAEVARREAELLIGAPGGVVPSPASCAPCPTPEVQTVIKEVVKEADLTPPGWWKEADIRTAEILDRELSIAEREREIGKREESVNRREHDASRRETWIMEQLMWALSFFCPSDKSNDFITALLATMHRKLSRKSIFTNPRARSVKPRYRRLPRAVPSSETKEDFDTSFPYLHIQSVYLCPNPSPPSSRQGLFLFLNRLHTRAVIDHLTDASTRDVIFLTGGLSSPNLLLIIHLFTGATSRNY
jgi:hypothetical protein